MRTTLAAATLLLTACATLPPLRPADPSQAVPNERSAATAVAQGVRLVVRPGAPGYAGDVEEYFTPIEVEIHNDSGRALRLQPASFSLVTPDGARHDALTTEEVRRAFGPFRGSIHGMYGYSYYGSSVWGGPFFPWASPYSGYWGWWVGPSPWWGAVPYYGSGYGGAPRALAKGTLESGGHASVLLFFPVPVSRLGALAVDANLSDASGQKVASLRVPFAREGQRPTIAPLPPIAAPPAPPAQPPPAQPQPAPSWEDVPGDRPVGPPDAPQPPPPSS